MSLLQNIRGITDYYIDTEGSDCKLIAHRGLSGVAPENTLPAFELAGEFDYFGVECDVQVTKDGHFVVFHDESIDRMTNEVGKIKNMTLEQVKTLQITSGSNIEYFTSKNNTVTIPTLQEYLTVCNKYNLAPVIEIKEVNRLNDINKLVTTLNEFNLLNHSILISFNVEYLMKLRKLAPNIQIQYIVNEIEDDVIDICNKYSFDIDANAIMLYKNHIEECHHRKIKVNTWTVDEQDIANYLIKAKIDYITTNILHSKIL
ncbi:glycerophosphodiester phosphodiesterase [Haloplasma contractile]|uniref:Glycerophosphoryl diester phosphodiesterase protein n=1 Tax=Haloplasma contractile SSD-17B TaxID=1033810 RepID=F7PVB9_9MOLU|nr:glycerophosphodiester phosphodiesterase family protein [Haloplasma contractile]ERJ12916.1 Glycerophosphoryl diester phosphodiesterase protein [Haloplasma contractile SSD-17B]